MSIKLIRFLAYIGIINAILGGLALASPEESSFAAQLSIYFFLGFYCLIVLVSSKDVSKDTKELSAGINKLFRDESKATQHEPIIVINGKATTKAQARTIRCAIESFDSDLIEEGLGDDEHGIAMVKLYRTNIEGIRNLIFEDPEPN